MNQIILVGRISNIKQESYEVLKERIVVTLAIPRNYKNEEGIYETDFVPITLYNNIAKNTFEFTKVGDLIGVRGRIHKTNPLQELEIIADKVTFLSTSKEDNDEKD